MYTPRPPIIRHPPLPLSLSLPPPYQMKGMKSTMDASLAGVADAFTLQRTLSGVSPTTTQAPLYVVLLSSTIDLAIVRSDSYTLSQLYVELSVDL